MKRLMLIWIPALLVLVVLTGLPTIRAHADDTNIEQMIENAKTPADHEAIAKYYDQQGAKAHQEMQWHQKLLKACPSVINWNIGPTHTFWSRSWLTVCKSP